MQQKNNCQKVSKVLNLKHNHEIKANNIKESENINYKMINQKNISFEDFNIVKKIGRGEYGVVYIA